MPTEVTALEYLVEKYGLPGLVIGLLTFLLIKFASARKAETPEAQMAAALTGVTAELSEFRKEIAEQRTEMTDRFARLETEVKNMKERK
jgi:uncharacterized membrane-anchored protein YhcB (DUF1043 family)